MSLLMFILSYLETRINFSKNNSEKGIESAKDLF